MANSTEHVTIHMPKYETEPVQFDTPTPNVSSDIAAIQDFVREKAERTLKKCKHFEVSLPTSITGVTDDSNRIELTSFFQTPTLNELEIVSSNPDGSSIKLNQNQLKAVRQNGEFDVESIHFPGQRHRWRLSNLLQSGVQKANEVLFKELSWAIYMLLIFARDRVISNTFSFKATLRSWKRGFVSLFDALIGLPATFSSGIDAQVENERCKFLVIELSPLESEKAMHEAFCAQLPVLLHMLAEQNKYTRRPRNEQKRPPEMLPFPHHFITPNNVDIDLRLHNPDLQTKVQETVSQLLYNSTPRTWFQATKRRLINEYKHQQTELALSKEEVAKRVQAQINREYVERAFETIETSGKLEQLSPGLGRLIVAQAHAILAMQSVVDQLNEQLEAHLKTTREKIVREHPIKSKIRRWLEPKLFQERMNFIRAHEWDPHQNSIEKCRTMGNQQAAYFIQRDLTFRKDQESVLRFNLKSTTGPIRTIDCSRAIWFPKNWIVERTYPLPITKIPTQFAKKNYTSVEEERRTTLLNSDPDATYDLRRKIKYSTTTTYPFWRWKLCALRVYCWLSNTIYALCLVVPFASPFSFRALFSLNPFMPDYQLDAKDLKLHASPQSKTQTFVSRLVALWGNIRRSRQKFEQAPDRGLLGKNVQRIFNRFWNYIGKGLVGTVAVCIFYPISCFAVSTISFALGVLSPVWMPIVTLVIHILEILIYDADTAGEYGRKFFCVINIVITDFLLCGIVQPVLALVAILASPIVALLILIYALLHRCSRGMYDTIMFHLIVKRLARVPAHDSFLARRIAGPGLASSYFYQVSSPEVLAALEALIEQNELTAYRSFVERILMKPVEEFRQFFRDAFRPFSAVVQSSDASSIYNRMTDQMDVHTRQLQQAVQERHDRLRLHRGGNHNRIRLTETDLTTVLIEGAQLVEKWYPKRIFPYLQQKEAEEFWSNRDLENDDWLGLASKLLQELFCTDFLTPLEQTDACYSLQVDHLTLSKYVHMIDSANVHDDLDVVTSVYLPETSYSIHIPSFDQRILDPNQRLLDISSNYNGKYRVKKHGHIYKFFNRKPKYIERGGVASRFVDYTSISCRFSIPIRLPEVICINVIIFNRDDSTTTLKDVSLQEILQLIDYNRQFYSRLMFPRTSSYAPAATTAAVMNDDLVIINTNVNDNDTDDVEPLTSPL